MISDTDLLKVQYETIYWISIYTWRYAVVSEKLFNLIFFFTYLCHIFQILMVLFENRITFSISRKLNFFDFENFEQFKNTKKKKKQIFGTFRNILTFDNIFDRLAMKKPISMPHYHPYFKTLR